MKFKPDSVFSGWTDAACEFVWVCFLCLWLTTGARAAESPIASDIKQAEPTGAERTPALKYLFQLTNGKGIEVCDAYLARLNATRFERPPYCGRPDNAEVEGFSKLNLVPLTVEQIAKIHYRVDDFLRSSDQVMHEKGLVWRKALSQSLGEPPPEEYDPIKVAQNALADGYLRAYTYDPPINIDNDNSPDIGLILWQHHVKQCGQYIGDGAPLPVRGTSQALFLNPLGMEFVDTVKTCEVFGHPLGCKGNPTNYFHSVGYSVGIFKFKDQYYFDTFIDGASEDLQGKRQGNPTLHKTLAVLHHPDREKTRQICEYRMREPAEEKGEPKGPGSIYFCD